MSIKDQNEAVNRIVIDLSKPYDLANESIRFFTGSDDSGNYDKYYTPSGVEGIFLILRCYFGKPGWAVFEGVRRFDENGLSDNVSDYEMRVPIVINS